MSIEQTLRSCSSCEVRNIGLGRYPENHLDSYRKWQGKTTTSSVPPAFRDQDTGLEATFPFSVKETGKRKVDFVRIQARSSMIYTDNVKDTKRPPYPTVGIHSTPPRHPPPRFVRHLPGIQQSCLQPGSQA